MFRYLPEQASKTAPAVDWLHHWITDLSLLFTVLIVGSMLYFAVVYRKRNGVDHETPRIEGNNLLEIIWTVVPTIISIFIAYYGVTIYFDMQEGEEDALIINSVAQKWQWEFQYENGKSTVGEIVAPVGRPIKVVMTSRDVLHSFFVPAMRVKKDVVPGRYSSVVFTPVKTGTYHTFCTEYCGTRHSAMLAKLRIVSETEYERWVNDRSTDLAKMAMSPAKLGKQLYKEKACKSCHSLDGSRIVGPTFLKLYNKERNFEDGTTTVADEEYLRESILYPANKIVKGYGNQMPAQEGLLTPDQVSALIAFIRSVDGSAPVEEEAIEEDVVDLSEMSPEERGEYIYQSKACIGCHSLDGSKMVGPSFKGLYGRKAKLQDGTEYEANDEYIKNSILKPNDQIVEGYAPAMPPYEGQLNDDDINGVIAYLKTLK